MGSVSDSRKAAGSSRLAPLMAATMLAGLPLLAAAPAQADDFFWDGGSPGDNTPGGGSGSWWATETGPAAWVRGGTSRTWSDGGNVAIFGGTAGTVTIVANFGVRPDELVFNVGGYTITRDNPGGFLEGLQAITVNAGTTTIATSIEVTSNLTITGPGELVLSASNGLIGTTTVTGGATVTIGAHVAMGSATIALDDGTLRSTIDTAPANAISVFGSGTVSAATGRTLTLNGVMNVFAGATVTFGSATDTGTVLFNGSFMGAGNSHLVVAGGTLRDGGFLSAFGPSGLAAIGSTTVNAGATLDLSAISEAAVRNLMGAGNVMISPLNGVKPSLSLMVGEGETVEFAGVISGSGNVQAVGFPFVFPPTGADGIVILSGDNTYTGATYICDCTVLQLGNGGASGSIKGDVFNAGTLAFNRSDTYRFDGVIADDPLIVSPGKVVKNGSGNVVLTAASTYTGGTTVNSGGLIVNGSVVGLTTVNGGFVGGTGTFGALAINAGGSLSPGNSIGTVTVTGSLTMAAGSTYVVEVSPTDADRTNVVAGAGGTGNAVLTGATVVASYAPGTYVERRYTILNAAGGLGGTTFAGVAGAAPIGFAHSLAYDASNVYLVLDMALAQYTGLNRNQQAVASAISGYFNANGSILADFGALSPAGLTLVSGETGTGSVQAGLLVSDRFVEIITDPFVAGRGGDFGSDPAAADPAAFVAEPAGRGDRLSSDAAYAALLGKQSAHSADIVAQAFLARWKGWGAAYGATSTFAGNATIGSQDSAHRLFGVAAGADYRLGDSLVGFALGGAGSSFALENGLGGGSSGSFNAGLYGSQQFGSFYVTGAVAYGFHAARHSRTVGADTLSARFNAHSLSARVEGGYRFEMAAAALTPYAAVQATSMFLPAYSETSSGAAVFALNYARQTASAARFEFGAKVDRSFAMGDALLTLRGRAAWVHNAGATRAITAGFQQLPGTSFTIYGAPQARNAALVSAAAEIAWPSGFAASLSAQGEFATRATSFSASAKLSYRW